MSGRNRAQANGVAPHLLARPAGELWDRMEGEPGRWYARFEVYRSLGPNRCMMAAYRECAAREGLKAIQPDANWYQAFAADGASSSQRSRRRTPYTHCSRTTF